MPPIGIVDAGARLAGVWTGPGAAADVVVFDLELVPEKLEFGEPRRLVDSGRRVVGYSQHTDNATAIKCIDLGALAYLAKREARITWFRPSGQPPRACPIPRRCSRVRSSRMTTRTSPGCPRARFRF